MANGVDITEIVGKSREFTKEESRDDFINKVDYTLSVILGKLNARDALIIELQNRSELLEELVMMLAAKTDMTEEFGKFISDKIEKEGGNVERVKSDLQEAMSDVSEPE